MPELHDVALHFDDIEAVDAYTGDYLFKAQFNSFDESSTDGSVERKRTMSAAPNLNLPLRRVIQIFGENWIIGNGNSDGIFNRAIRKNYWLKRADPVMECLTPGQLLNGLPGFSFHASKHYLKDTVNGVTDSEYDPFWDIFAGINEPILRGLYLRDRGSLLRVRGAHEELSGFRLAQCDELDNPAETVLKIVTGKVYDAATDREVVTTADVPAIVMDAYKLYRYATKADVKMNAGDLTAVIAVEPVIGTEVVTSSGSYRVRGVQPELDAWMIHLVKP